MFSNKLLSSLHSAALALSLTAAMPAFAQSGTGLRFPENHGVAAGDWVPATASMPGSLHGRMADATGAARFEIFAITHVSVPAVISGYDVGTLYGRLMSQRLEGEAQNLKKGEVTKPVVDPASIYVLGRWSASQKDGSGRFSAVAFLEIAPLPLPIALLDIVGSFEVRPQPSKAALLAGPETDPVAASGTGGRPRYAKRLEFQAKLLANSGGAKPIAALKADDAFALHFVARWLMRN